MAFIKNKGFSMDKQVLSRVIDGRTTIEQHVKYVGVFALGDRQALILGQTCYDDLEVVSYAHLELQQRGGSHMTYSSRNKGCGGSPFFPIPISQLDNQFEAQFYNKGMQMLLDAGARVPAEKRNYPEVTLWKDELLKRDRLTIRDVRLGEYYALVDHEHEDDCKAIDVLRMGPVLDYNEGIFIPGEHEYLLGSSVLNPSGPNRRGAYSFHIVYLNSPLEAAMVNQSDRSIFIFSYNYFNRPEQEHGALNITYWWKAEYGATDGKFISVTKDDLKFLQDNAQVVIDDLVKHFTPRFLEKSAGLKNEQAGIRSLRTG